jgi:polyhydroxyalkanoate synthase
MATAHKERAATRRQAPAPRSARARGRESAAPTGGSQAAGAAHGASAGGAAPRSTAHAAAPKAAGLSIGLRPERLLALQQDYMQRLSALWRDFIERPEKAAEPIRDARFSDPAWQQNSLAAFYARAYLLNAEFMNQLAASVEAEPKLQKRLRFAVSQWVDAASPSNFVAFNPQVQQRLIETQGESLKAGLENLLKDLGKGKISQSDERAFEVGRNVATSEGAVVFENELIQLIQYKPLTPKVHVLPFLIVPPCINKYYILDLQPENSLIRYCVEQGHTVFVVSWKNVHADQGGLTWDDYLELGPIKAVHVTQDIGGSERINALGFCVGGTLVATALAVLRARGEDPVESLTLLTSLLDFEDAGVLDIFIDEAQVQLREATIGRGGIMPGRDLANTFSSLRANDLVWNYVVNNYLEGRQPPAFDLLHWNGDSTNLPGPMYAWYLRNMYLENNLRVPGRLHCCGQAVDLNTLTMPTYVFAAREDHIVPWKAAYASARLLPGDRRHGVRFVLGASGHIAGTINPASKNKRSFWTGRDGSLPANSEAWLAGAQERSGSWWTDWSSWLAQFGGGQKAAPKGYGNARYPIIEPAPGRYVKEAAT